MLYWVESGIELKSGSGGGWMKQSTLVKFKHGLNNYIFNCFAYFEWLIFFDFWIKLVNLVICCKLRFAFLARKKANDTNLQQSKWQTIVSSLV